MQVPDDGRAVFDAGLIQRYDRPGPRYTSYPTAVQFHPGFGVDEYVAAARASNAPGRDGVVRPLSLYVHVPFCASPCFYCGCNKVITRDHSKAALYLDRLYREIERQGALYDKSRPVNQLHFGGGTPTFLSTRQIAELLEKMRRHFALTNAPDREYSIEIDPRTIDLDRLEELSKLGFNRVSLGVQDFDAAVQVAVNRVQSCEGTLALISRAREVGIESVSVDLIYGLPKQNRTTFARTLDLVIDARPDRIATYSYAHLPHLFKPQRQIRTADLISAAEKLGLLELTVQKLSDAGYVYVGMDHFALPTDELVRAQRAGTLHRNFQGYSTQAECDLVAFGVSSISKVGDAYAQNAKTLNDYYAAIDAGGLAVRRGVQLTRDDRIRRDVIQRLMCATRLSFEEVEAEHGIVFEEYFLGELEQLRPLEADGLVRNEDRGLVVTGRGRLLMRNVAMPFDAHLPEAQPVAPGETPRFSRAV
ncbi:MAG: oxygen-independent coproporphyrinogen III oxidase [Steroidobacteraceae bacterium]|jgi:oxygen-independent coproporphyrinogen-3 oxidase|nr:oxygen-independent coproporphyrinogen III oxidase [Steroidobacteraceae bacterium]